MDLKSIKPEMAWNGTLDCWELDESLDIPCIINHVRSVVHVPKGFVTDGASIPRALWSIAGCPYDMPRLVAAIAHDALYAAQLTTRGEADAAFRGLNIALGVAPWRARVEYYALRLFGGFAWASHLRAADPEAYLGAITISGDFSETQKEETK